MCKCNGNDRSTYLVLMREAVRDLTKALHERNLRALMAEYDEQHTNEPNCVYGTTYLEMAEILLDVIFANLGGNWEFHLLYRGQYS